MISHFYERYNVRLYSRKTGDYQHPRAISCVRGCLSVCLCVAVRWWFGGWGGGGLIRARVCLPVNQITAFLNTSKNTVILVLFLLQAFGTSFVCLSIIITICLYTTNDHEYKRSSGQTRWPIVTKFGATIGVLWICQDSWCVPLVFSDQSDLC